MDFFLGAILSVTAITLLHLGRLARANVASPADAPLAR